MEKERNRLNCQTQQTRSLHDVICKKMLITQILHPNKIGYYDEHEELKQHLPRQQIKLDTQKIK
ncbi:MAG: hypothetical protein ACFCUV_15575 [Rivularia sp. (in: cyanobacteria)]